MPRLSTVWTCSILVLAATATSATEPSSTLYRLIGSGPASVAATATSPLYRAQLAGGSGAAVGIAASPNSSVVAGPLSQELPTDRILRSSFEE